MGGGSRSGESKIQRPAGDAGAWMVADQWGDSSLRQGGGGPRRGCSSTSDQIKPNRLQILSDNTLFNLLGLPVSISDTM